LLDGTDVAGLSDDKLADIRGRKIRLFVFQAYNLLPARPRLSNVELPLVYANTPTRQQRPQEALSGGRALRPGQPPAQRVVRWPAAAGGDRPGAGYRAMMMLADEPTGNLDSTSSAEIAQILVRLNKKGRTVVLITHEEEIASHADPHRPAARRQNHQRLPPRRAVQKPAGPGAVKPALGRRW